MRTVVLAGLEYATEHPEWPATLEELKPKYLAAGKIDLGQFIYHPPGPESLEENPQDVAVLSEKEPAFAGGRLVGFADGYIEFVREFRVAGATCACRDPIAACVRRRMRRYGRNGTRRVTDTLTIKENHR